MLVSQWMRWVVMFLTLIQRQREKGRVAMMSRTDRQVRMQAAGPGPSGSAG